MSFSELPHSRSELERILPVLVLNLAVYRPGASDPPAVDDVEIQLILAELLEQDDEETMSDSLTGRDRRSHALAEHYKKVIFQSFGFVIVVHVLLEGSQASTPQQDCFKAGILFYRLRVYLEEDRFCE